MKDAVMESVKELEERVHNITDSKETIVILEELNAKLKGSSADEVEEVTSLIWDISCEAKLGTAIQIKSYIVDKTMQYEYFVRYCRYISQNAGVIPADTLYFLQAQLCVTVFRYQQFNTYEVKYILWDMLKTVVSKFAKELGDDILSPIPAGERNDNLVVVFTNQFLGMTHGPTKTALDRCEVLMRNMNKQVILVNTSETTSLRGGILLYSIYQAGYIKEHCECDHVDYNGLTIPFFQCENNMPDIDTIRQILNMVRDLKPKYLVNIGGDDITSNLAAKIIPAVTIDLCPSETTGTLAACQTVTRPLIKEDYELLDKLSIPKWHYLEATFTSSLKEQTEKHSRQEIGVADDAFTAGIMGARLDVDLTEEFLNLLCKASKEYKVHYIVFGKFDNIAIIEDKYPELVSFFHYVGFVSDALSYLELCDIYINPTRRGGGTAAIEALYKGCPVLTTPFGDTSTGVGEEFWTKSYDTMLDLIGKYASDKEFLEEMSQKARERAADMLDSAAHFAEVLKKFEKVIGDEKL